MAKTQDSKEVLEKQLPPFVQYLSEPDTPYDCWFHVVNPDRPTNPPEKIGGSKLHLMSHSILFRRMLHESPLAETGPITIPDIAPNPFRHLLRFLHGHFVITYLSLEESVALLYAAEKYFVDDLCQRLGVHIASLITVDNIFLPLMKQECFRVKTLEKAMIKIIRQETRNLVAKDEFLKLNAFGILTILTQKCLQISEIELWRAVLKWAKYQGGTDKTEELREVLSEPLKLVRFCTMDGNDFNREVATTGILTDIEIASVVKILGGAATIKTSAETMGSSDCTSVNYDVNVRELFSGEEYEIDFSSLIATKLARRFQTYFYLTTRTKAVQLLSVNVIKLALPTASDTELPCKKIKLSCECTFRLERITLNDSRESLEKVQKFQLSNDFPIDSDLLFHFPKNKLLPQSTYRLIVVIAHKHNFLYSPLTNETLNHEYLSVSSSKDRQLISQVQSLKFKVL